MSKTIPSLRTPGAKSMNNKIILKNWINVKDKVKVFDLGNFKQTISKDMAISNAVLEIIKTFKKYSIDMGYFYNKFYVYKEDYWNEISEEVIEVFIRDCCKNIYKKHIKFHTSSFYKSVKETYRDDLRVIIDNTENNVLLNLNNVTLEFSKEGFYPRDHNKNDYLIYKLKYDYDENETCYMWDKFLNEMLPDEKHQLLLHQYIGYTFTNHLKLEKALFLYGEGGNGKSVVQEVITKLLGKENTASVSLGKLTKDPNTIMLIEGKLLNYCSENEKTLDLAIFKTLVSGEPVLGKKLYKDVRSVTNYAKLMFNLNSLPNINDEKESYLRRLLILEFNKTPKKVDPELHFKIIKTELSGIFNRVLKALQILLKEKSFLFFEELDEILDKYKYEHDVVQQYIDEVHETGFPNGPTKVSEIHELYVLFCNKHQEQRLSLTSFAKELIKKGYKKTAKKDGSYYDLGVVGGSGFTETFENNNL